MSGGAKCLPLLIRAQKQYADARANPGSPAQPPPPSSAQGAFQGQECMDERRAVPYDTLGGLRGFEVIKKRRNLTPHSGKALELHVTDRQIRGLRTLSP